MKIAFVIDPIASFNPLAETTFYLMTEMTRRKWEYWGIETKNLTCTNGRVHGLAQKLSVTHSAGCFKYKILREADLDLAKMDAVLLRKDPPVDLAFFDHLSLLELLRGKTLLVNDPTGIKTACEKIFPLYFDGIFPETIVSRNGDALRDFIHKHGEAVLKPLNLSGGRGIIKVKANDSSLNSLIDIVTENGSRTVQAQKFVAEVAKGDKRILVLDGKILGAFLRVPAKSDFRGNLHSGAKLKKVALSTHDKKIVERLAPELKKRGLYFVGLDLIGNFVTEINVTSPMGLGEINHLFLTQSEKTVVNWLQQKSKDLR